MLRLLRATIAAVLSGFRSRREPILENVALRQQLATVLQKRRPLIRSADRAFWVVLLSAQGAGVQGLSYGWSFRQAQEPAWLERQPPPIPAGVMLP